MLKNIREHLAIGSIVDTDKLQEIHQQGYHTIIDLCTEREGNLLDEKAMTDLGFKYLNIPVSPQNINMDTLNNIKEAINCAPQYVYIRCASGLRAGVMTLLTIADEENWTQEQYQAEFAKLELQHKENCPLKDFTENYFTQQ
ncbi:beta-lactamase hydrolase domain-containing protein [Geminocystis sp. CENA526]|uniref:beta-lactamase hydrolase domain-containing protein n=1 Tax=Geminocystis sp. CENA526 TaxID=1355871 RepID=UPI003D6F42B3